MRIIAGLVRARRLRRRDSQVSRRRSSPDLRRAWQSGICPVRQSAIGAGGCNLSGRSVSWPSARREGYRALDDKSVAELPGRAARASARGSAASPRPGRCARSATATSTWSSSSTAPPATLCVKQALPYVRLVGEGWPLDLKRAWFEHRAASIQSRHAAQRIPELLHFDERLYLIAMECCRPHVIMRRGMIEGVVYPAFAAHIAEYLATTLYFTSDMALPAAEKRELVAAFSGNTELCKITEDLIFTDPYMVCSRNRWTSPQLDDVAAEIRGDAALKRAVSALKLKFLSEVSGPAARRPAHRLDHGDGRGHQGDRPGVRGHGADGLRRRQAPGQPAAEPLQPARPRAGARRARRLSRAGSWRRSRRSGTASAAASSSCGTAYPDRRRLPGAAVRRARRSGVAARGPGRLHAPPVRGRAGLRRAPP